MRVVEHWPVCEKAPKDEDKHESARKLRSISTLDFKASARERGRSLWRGRLAAAAGDLVRYSHQRK